MAYLRFAIVCLTLGLLTALFCWIASSIGDLDPILAIVLFPFGVLAIAIIADSV